MTGPTKAVAPLMLEDYHRVLQERPGSGPVFDKEHIAASLARATAVQLEQTVVVSEGFEITAFYAGHVLGAAVFHVRVGHQTLVYTGG
jgi:integrator complex subunit 11